MAISPIIAPVINNTPNPNEVRVADCLAYNLSLITDTTFLPKGMLVDRRRDPRLFQQNKPAEYLQKNAAARIAIGNGVYVPKGSVGGGAVGKRRTHQTIIITTIQTMTQELDSLGVTADQLKGWMRHAITAMINGDVGLKTAAAALVAQYPTWGNFPSCIDLKITKVIAAPVPNKPFPDIAQAFQIEFLFDEYGTTMQAGYGP